MSSRAKAKETWSVKSKGVRRPETGIGSGVRWRNNLSSKRGSGGMGRSIGCSSGAKCSKRVADASTELWWDSGAKSKQCLSGKRKRVSGNHEDTLEDEVVRMGVAGKIKEMLDMKFMEHTALLQKHAEEIQNDFKKKMRSVEKNLKGLTDQLHRCVSRKGMLPERYRVSGDSDEESDELQSSNPYEARGESSEYNSGEGFGYSISDRSPSPTVLGLSSDSEEGYISGEAEVRNFEEAVVGNKKLVQKFERSRGKNVVAFKLRNPASDEQFRIAMYLFARNLLSDRVVVRIGKTELSREDLWSLRPGECVNGTVISAYAILVTLECRERAHVERERRGTWYLPLRVSVAELGKIDCLHHAMSMSLFDRFCGVFCSCERIVAPVHDQMHNHWFLAVIRLGSKNVEVWDSLSTAKSRTHRKELVVALLSTLDRLFKTFILQRFDHYWSFTKLDVVHRGDLPKQEGGVDCGAFLLHFMRCLSHGLDEHCQFDVEETRLRIGMELFTSKFNEVRHPLTIEAGALYAKCKDGCNGGKQVGSGKVSVRGSQGVKGTSFGVKNPVPNPVVAKAKRRKVKAQRSRWTRVRRPRG